MTGQSLRDNALDLQQERNPLTIEQFLNEIATTRKCRLRTRFWDQTFTIEELMTEVQSRCRLPAKHSLAGAIGRLARTRGLVEETGLWTAAKRDSRHANRSPLCRWRVDSTS